MLTRSFKYVCLMLCMAFPVFASGGIKILRSDNSALDFIFTAPPVSLGNFDAGGSGRFLNPSASGACLKYGKPGEPVQLVRKEMVAVPGPNAFRLVSYNVLESETKTGRILPTPSMRKTEELSPVEDYAVTEHYAGYVPDASAKVRFAGISANRTLAELEIPLATYFPATGEIKILKQAEIRIAFDESGSATEPYMVNKEIEGRMNAFSMPVINGEQGKKWEVGTFYSRNLDNDFVNFLKNPSAQSSDKLSGGLWYRLKISEEGIYRIDRSFLSAAGINIPKEEVASIKIFGHGGTELPREVAKSVFNDLNEQEIIVETESDGSLKAVVFYGAPANGFEYLPNKSGDPRFKFRHYTNHFSKDNYYLLTWGGSDGKRAAASQPEGEVVNTPQTFVKRLFYEEELLNAFKNGSGNVFIGRTYFNEPFSNKLENIVREGDLLYRIGVAHKSENPGYFEVSDNGTVLVDKINLSGFSDDYIEGKKQFKEVAVTGNILPADNTSRIKLKYVNSKEPVSSNGYFDFYEIHYTSQNKASGNTAEFFTDPALTGISAYDIGGFSSAPLGFDVTKRNAPALLKNNGSGGTFSFRVETAGNDPRRVFISSSFKTPAQVEQIDFGNLRTDFLNTDVIMIAYKDFLPSAEEFKKYREANSGLSIGIVRTDHIYNEFSSSLPDITAIRDFIAFAFNNWEKQPKYVILWGDGHYDHRNIMTGKINYVPAHTDDDEPADTFEEIYSTSTDDYFARVAGNDALIDVAIARFTIESDKQGSEALAKIKHYEQNSSEDKWRTAVALVADDGPKGGNNTDNSLHTGHSEELAAKYIPDYMQIKKIYLPEYTTEFISNGRSKPGCYTDIINTVNNEGVLILNFTGHGNPQVWTHEGVLDRDKSIPAMTNLDKLFLLTAATCDFGKFDNPNVSSGSERMFSHAIGGAIAVFSATRVVFAGDNSDINNEFYSNLFKKEEDGERYLTIGEALFRTKQAYYGVNSEKFFLIGDPTLRILIPENNIIFDKINGSERDGATDTILVKGLEEMNIEGSVKDVHGNVIEGFNGTVELTFLDGDVDLKVKDEFNATYAFMKYGGGLAKGTFEVKDGRFNARFILPKDISFSDRTARLFGYATSEGGVYAKGSYNKIKVQGLTETHINDDDGPEISLFLDSRSFVSGSVVRDQPLLLVDLYDATGINSTGVGIGHKIEAWIDDNTQSIDLTSSYQASIKGYNYGSASKVLSGLSTGMHRVRVRAWDVLNNFSEAETWFNILPPGEAVSVQNIYTYPNPFSDGTMIVFEHNMNPPFDAVVHIYSSEGREVKTIETKVTNAFSAEVPWPGNDNSERALAPGPYYISVSVKGAEGFSGTGFSGGSALIVR